MTRKSVTAPRAGTPRKPKTKKPWSPLGIYPAGGQWYWNLVARNGNIVADGSEGYSSRAKALQGFRSAAKLSALALAQMEGK